MRVLVTGCTASQTKEGDTIASFLGQALRDAGHDVTVERPSLRHAIHEDLGGDFDDDYVPTKPWDWVFVGLGPLHGLGTAHMYGALGTIGRYWDRCTLFLDDVDSGKIGGGFRTMLNVEGKLTRPFFGYKKEWKLASQPDVTAWLLEIIDSLAHTQPADYPRVIVPSFTLDEAFRVASRVSGAAGYNVVPLDPTVYAAQEMTLAKMGRLKYGDGWQLKLAEAFEDLMPRMEGAPWWAVEHEPTSAAVRSYGPFGWHQVRTSKNPALGILSSGYIAPTEQWSPRFAQLPAAGIPIVTAWYVFAKEIGDAYEVLASQVETMTGKQRDKLATQQLAQLETFSPSKQELAKKVDLLMEEPNG